MTGISQTTSQSWSRARAWRVLLVLAVVQVVVALAARIALWPPANFGQSLSLLRFVHWDLVAIASLMGSLAAVMLLAERWRFSRTAALAAAWTLALLHCLLLAANVTAIHWLRVPMTWQWLYFSDLGRTQTPLAVAASVVTPASMIGALAALAAPFVFWQAAKRAKGWMTIPRERVAAVSIIALVAITPVISPFDAPERDRWRDAVTNPGYAMARSLWTDGAARLASVEGDGQTGDYATQPARAAAAPRPNAQAETRPDIVLVVLESVSRDSVLKNRAALPTFDALIKRGTHYPAAGVTNSNSVRSIFELYFSRFPVVGYQPESYLYDRIDSTPVPVAMEAAGYRSALFMASDLAYQGAGPFLARHGVTGLNDIDQISCDDGIVLTNERWQDNDYLPDDCVFAATQDWLLEQREPAFVTIWTGPTHFPYIPPVKTNGEPAAEDAAQRHLQALQETDRVLGNFLKTLARAGRDPLVIVVSDHGEAFGLHGTNVHGYTIFEDETAIPFIMAGPGIEADVTDRRLVSLADIGPTLMSYVGGAQPAGWQGLSVLGETQRQRAYRFAILQAPLVGYREGARKYVLNLREDSAAFYNLDTDPDEQSPTPATAQQKRAIERAVAGWMRYNRTLNEGE